MANDYNNFSSWADVKQYCIDRLEEIKQINATSQTPSGFVCIAAFIGFLSNLASGKAEFGHDNKNYTEFAKNYMKGLCPTKVTAKQLYKTLRCGLLHSMSFSPAFKAGKMPSNHSHPRTNPSLAITHDKNPQNASQFKVVLTFDELYSEVQSAINSMFNDPIIQSNAMEVVYWQPPIRGVLCTAKTIEEDSDEKIDVTTTPSLSAT